jgi:hypothetical protein
MPTISEPQWPIKDEKRKQIVSDFLANLDTLEVFRARLYGTGLRGQDLFLEVHEALHLKCQAIKPEKPTEVLVMQRDGKQFTFRFNTDFNAGYAVERLRKQPHVLFASRVYL